MRLRRFLRDEKGTTFEGVALAVSIVAVGFVASADMLDYLTKSHDGNPVEMAASGPTHVMAKDANLDDTPTGSLPKLISRSVLDPCTGAVK